MKSIIQKVLGIFGIKVIKAKNYRRYLPKPCVDNVEIVVRFYQLMNKKIKILQVGACDGVTSDSINGYIKAGSVEGFLVEPSQTNFEKLKTFYANFQNATLINAAIGEKDEIRDFYSVKDAGRWSDNAWARQLASFYKPHLLKHGIEENEISIEKVQCYTVSTIVNKYQIKDLDVLLIDTEGYDGEIVKMALKQKIYPNFIVFENVQLLKIYHQAELDSLYQMLKNNGYVWTHDRINTMAVKNTFFDVT
jgi:FkbM family methyltransferase